MVELVDVFPTVSYMAGLEAPPSCPDVSFQVSRNHIWQFSAVLIVSIKFNVVVHQTEVAVYPDLSLNATFPSTFPDVVMLTNRLQ